LSQEALHYYLAYLPLGTLGLIRWASWLVRRLPASLYRPVANDFRLPLSLVVPVYQEDPEIFARAIESWLANRVHEIVLVIDETDTVCIAVASRYPVSIIVTDVPGKRDALRRGWEACTTDLVALVDSDTIWAEDVADEVCKPFADPRVGGVGTRQNVYKPRGFLQRVNDMYLDYRYFDENASQTVMGRAVSCLSGRTAVYRRTLLLEISDEFMNETFLGVPCMSGDDKRLTTLILERGHHVHAADGPGLVHLSRHLAGLSQTATAVGAQHLAFGPAGALAAVGAASPVSRLHDGGQGGQQLHAARLPGVHDVRHSPAGLVLRGVPGHLVVDQPRREDPAAPGAPAVVLPSRARVRRRLLRDGDRQDLRASHDSQAAVADAAGAG
jgi:hypothetical protein